LKQKSKDAAECPPQTLMAVSGGRVGNNHAAGWCLGVEMGPRYPGPSQKRKVGPRHEEPRSRFDTKTPSSCMVVAHTTTTDSHERFRVGTQQHLPTFDSKSVREPSTGLMDRHTQHRPMTLTIRTHKLSSVSRHAVLMVTIDTTHSGRLQSAPYTQKYVKSAVFGTVPTNTHANGPDPAILQPHPPRIRCLHGTGRLCRQQPSCSTATSSGDGCTDSFMLRRPTRQCRRAQSPC
jgi:hypothetical protein